MDKAVLRQIRRDFDLIKTPIPAKRCCKAIRAQAPFVEGEVYSGFDDSGSEIVVYRYRGK